MKNINIYKETLNKSSMAFAYHEAIYDNHGNMIDYRFLDINEAFTQTTGLTRKQVIGKLFVKEVALDKNEAQKWVKIYTPVVVHREEKLIEAYSDELKASFITQAFSPQEHHFVTVFHNTNNEYKMEKMATYFLDHAGKKIDYQLLTKTALEFSGANYAIFNLFDEKKNVYITKALIGTKQTLPKIIEMIGENLIGSIHERSDFYKLEMDNTNIVEFDDLSQIAGIKIDETILAKLQSSFDITKTVIAEIRRGDKIYGNLALLFTKGAVFQRNTYFNIYLKQLGVFIDKCQLEHELSLKELEAQHLATRMKKDILTNAYNRTAITTLLTDRITVANSAKIKCYFILLDIDNFKSINDKYGHQIGDKVLQLFVDRINAEIRKKDILIRYGGDEFILYLENLQDDKEAEKFMQRLFKLLVDPYIVSSKEFPLPLNIELSLSAGISRFPLNGKNVKELIRKADFMMYEVKKSGKNNFAFFPIDKKI